MLRPYGRAPVLRRPSAVSAWIGGRRWVLVEQHELTVAAPPAVALEAVLALRLERLPAVRTLFALRGLPHRPDATLRDFFSTDPFVPLEEETDRELVAGVLLPARGEDLSRESESRRDRFRRVLERARLAAVVTFRADPHPDGAVLWTETWVRSGGALARALFEAYWILIGPWSAWIRRMFLRAAREGATDRMGR